ncbi:MAG: biotin--[acetyl-CoA-carboxylase] ligase [Pseudomonadota bacterium]
MSGRMPQGYALASFETLDSTMDEARRRAAEGVHGPLWIMAAHQTKGRGRRSRAWESGTGNLLCTLLFEPGVAPAEAAKLSFLAAICAGETLDHYLGSSLRIRYKWPNDVLLDGRKVAGILLESASDSGGISWLSIGIGINLAQHPEGAPTPATSLRAAGVAAPGPLEVLEILAGRFADWLTRWRNEGFAPVKSAWLARAARMGARIEVRLDKETLPGIFTALDDSGALVLTLADGTKRLISAGDVFFPEI